MIRVRSQYDADRLTGFEPADHCVDEDRFPLPCSVCGNEFYVDETTIRQFECALDYDADNTFVCQACEDYYDEISHH